MAKVDVIITVETDILQDAIDDIKRVHAALARRHGSDFRRLDRRIEAFACSGSDLVKMHKVEGKPVAAPSGELTAVLVEARRLGMLT